MSGSLSLLKETRLTQSQIELIDIAFCASKNMESILTDVLQLSRLNSRAKHHSETSLYLHHFISDVLLFFKQEASKKKIELCSQVEDNARLFLKCDFLKLHQVLNNLISNAIKYTDTGFVKVKVKALKNYAQKVMIQCDVEDSGPGICAEDSQKIFSQYFRSDRHIHAPGTGLGLVITKKLVHILGGQIWFKSDSHGTTFSFTATCFSEASLTSKKILVCEDNILNQKLIAKILEQCGVSFDAAQNGKEALDFMKHTSYDLVFMDCQMPLLDGYETSRRIRNLSLTVPIIAMTGNTLSRDQEECFKAGMNDYISKPFKIEDIKDKLQQWLSSHK
jgi:CheY-like chemotaxis protein